MRSTICAVAALVILAGCTQTMKSEPKSGTLGAGVKVLVDDGSCPAGEIKQVTGGNNMKGIGRKRECIPRSE
jgi:hypothetical protein